jgi:hypothetical protein
MLVVAATLAGALTPGAASAAVTCSSVVNGPTTITLGADEDEVRIVRSGQVIQVYGNGVLDGCATTPQTIYTTAINVTDISPSGQTFLEIDLSGGPFVKAPPNPGAPGEIPINFDGGTDNDFVEVDGSSGAETLRTGLIGIGLQIGLDLNGDGDSDVASSLGEDVSLAGGGGNDTLSSRGDTGPFVGPVRGRLAGGAGNDVLAAGVVIGQGNTLAGGPGNDQLLGAAGVPDSIEPGAGDDFANAGGGPDPDTLSSFFDTNAPVRFDIGATGPQNTGSLGVDTLLGFEYVTSGSGDDLLIGDGGDNFLSAGNGSDTVVGRGGDDILSGGGGFDFASYAIPPPGVTTGVTIDLGVNNPGVQPAGSAGADKINADVEGVVGSPFPDTLTGDENANTMKVRDGRTDTVVCLVGADTVEADLTGVDAINADCETKLFDVRPETAITRSPGALLRTRTPTFVLASSEPASTFQCAVDAAAFSPCAAAFTTPPLGQGPHRLQARAVDQYGNLDLSPVAASFTVDTVAPTLSKVSFRRGKLRLTLSEAASLTIALERRAKGRRSRGKCRPKAKKGRRCSVYVKVKSKRATGKKGKNTIAFKTGRLKARTTYRLAIVARDAAGNATKPKRLPVRR